jgi:hypothetical protein
MIPARESMQNLAINFLYFHQVLQRRHTTHPGASSKVRIEILNLNLPRIIDTAVKCELQAANDIRKTAKLYGAQVKSLPLICAT